MKRAIALLLTALVTLGIAACGAAAGTPGTTAGGPLTVTGAWARAAAAGANTAIYFTIVNGRVAADTLTGVSSDLAKMTEVHETTSDPSGMTGMHMVPSVPVPGGGTVQFAPGGYHVMLTGLNKALNPGDQVTVTLTFQNAGTVTVTAEVRAS